jgi:hypothetical protein
MKQPRFTQHVLFLSFILVLFFVSCNKPDSVLTTPSPVFPTPTEISPEQRACEEQGGQWGILGLSGWRCNLPTSDGGKVCYDNDDCESLCIGQLSQNLEEASASDIEGRVSESSIDTSQLIEELNARGEAVGSCSAWKSTLGCQLLVIERQYQYICID